MELGLGTVQFGMNYGLSNRDGQTAEDEVKKIINFSGQHKVRVLDTAASYGNSEQVLGNAMPADHPFDIIAKTIVCNAPVIGTSDAERLKDTFQRTLANLRQSKVAGLLIHNADDLLARGGQRLFESMEELKEAGEVEKIGVSVYEKRQIDGVLKKYSIDLIQVPVNILDQRLIKSGHLKELKTAGVEVHARSVFLQGLMLMNPAELSDFFNSIKPHLTNYHAVLMEHGYTPVQAALDFIRSIGQIDVVICGVNSLKQLSELMDGFNSEKGADGLFSEFGIDAPEILNPALWGR